MKRFLGLTLSLFLVLAMAVPVLAEKTPINIWFAGTDEAFMKTMSEEVIPAFAKANPDIELLPTFVPWSDLSTKLTTSFAAGVGPDVFMHGAAATAGFASNDRVQPLDGYIAKMEDAADFGATFNAGVYRGKKYMIPAYGAGRLLMYRADFFKEAGLDPDKPPKTWEEFRQVAKKLTIKKGNRFVREGIDLPSQGIDAQQVYSLFLWQAGGSFLNEDGAQATFNSKEGVKALQFLVDLVRKDGVADEQINMGQGNISPIVPGQIAMLFAVPGDLKQVEKYSPDIYKQIRVAMPLKDKEQATLFSFSGFFMSKDSKNKDAAWRVIKYFSSKEALAKLCESMSSLPPRKSLKDLPFIAKDPNIVAYVEAMEFAQGNPNIPEWVKIRDILSRYIEQAYFGAMTPKAALDKAAAEVNALLKK